MTIALFYVVLCGFSFDNVLFFFFFLSPHTVMNSFFFNGLTVFFLSDFFSKMCLKREKYF
jgi:hypothetical protein